MALTNLSQIKGGLQLQQDVQGLKTSYDAKKVLTDIAYPVADGEEARSYNVNELLSALKEKISDITGGDESLSSLSELSEAISALENKKIKDIVSVSLTGEIRYDTQRWGVNVVQYPALRIPGIDKTKKLPVYTADNYVVVDGEGKQLLLDLETGEFSGTPSVLDEEASAAAGKPCYKAHDGKYLQIKVFPVGEWSLKDIPTEYLLDNIEMQALACRSAIDSLAVDIAKDKSLIEAVKELIGEKAVSDQLADKVNVSDIQTTIRDKDAASDEKVASELAVAKEISVISGNIEEANTKADGNTESIGQIKNDIQAIVPMLTEVAEVVNITGEGYVSCFELKNEPNNELVKMNINGLVYYEGIDLAVNREEKEVYWTSNDFSINKELADRVIITYHTGKYAGSTASTETTEQNETKEPEGGNSSGGNESGNGEDPGTTGSGNGGYYENCGIVASWDA